MRFRVTVDYGDDRIRTYLVYASDISTAETISLEYAQGMLSVAADDDVEDYPDDFDAVFGPVEISDDELRDVLERNGYVTAASRIAAGEGRKEATAYMLEDPPAYNDGEARWLHSYIQWLHHTASPVPLEVNERCGSCGADIGPSSSFPWHDEDEDCRSIRQPLRKETR